MLGLDAAREEARTRLALGMGVAYRTDKRKRREDGAPREPRTEHRGSPTRSTAGAPHGALREHPEEHCGSTTRSITRSITQSITRSTAGAP